jgi:hypothetical protein
VTVRRDLAAPQELYGPFGDGGVESVGSEARMQLAQEPEKTFDGRAVSPGCHGRGSTNEFVMFEPEHNEFANG